MGKRNSIVVDAETIWDITPFDERRDSFYDIAQLVARACSPPTKAGVDGKAVMRTSNAAKSRIVTAAECWVARIDRWPVGTICYYPSRGSENEPAWYARSDVCHFGLFVVEPNLQRLGIGTTLLAIVERRGRKDGKFEIACDAADGATHLIDFCAKRGYQRVGEHRWRDLDYRSVVLSKPLRAPRRLENAG